jgi:hypothetical protein
MAGAQAPASFLILPHLFMLGHLVGLKFHADPLREN